MSTLTTQMVPRAEKPAANGHQLGNPYQMCIPLGLDDLESYRRWARSTLFPRRGEFAFLDGLIWVDLSMEQLFTHNQVKAEICTLLRGLIRSGDLGYLFFDRASLANATANLSCEPDATFVAYATLEAGHLQFVEGKERGFVELEGTLDMVLEIVSDGSVEKDTVTLRSLYWRAGIPEFWLVDVRGAALQFDILRRGKKDYIVTRKQAGGWVSSSVFGRSFLLTRQTDRLGHPQFILAVRE